MPSNREIAKMLSFKQQLAGTAISWDTKFVRDQGWKVAEEAFAELDKKGLSLKIGVQSDEDPYPNGETVAKIAAWNHFGTKSIPARPYLTKAIDENSRKLENFSSGVFKKIMDGMNLEQALGLLGEEVVSVIRKMITTLSQPPNAPSTIKKKGSSNPLIDTGRLRASQRWVVINKFGVEKASAPKISGGGSGGGISSGTGGGGSSKRGGIGRRIGILAIARRIVHSLRDKEN